MYMASHATPLPHMGILYVYMYLYTTYGQCMYKQLCISILPIDITYACYACLSDLFFFFECVSKIKNIFSVIHYTIYGAVCFQFTHFPCDDWENIHFVLLSSSNRKYELSSIV